MDLSFYISKHDSIRNELSAIERIIRKNLDDNSSSDAASSIVRLSAVIKMHLASEDTYLYPSLLKNSNEKVRLMTKAYESEMKNLEKNIESFLLKYNTPSKISANCPSFAFDFALVYEALNRRMDREEKELYKFI